MTMTSKAKRTPSKAKQKHHAPPVKAGPKRAKATMKRAAKPTDPQQARIVFMPMQQTGGVRVDEDKALTYSVVWSCVRVIAETIGALSWHVMEEQTNGDKSRVAMSSIEWILHRQANDEMSAGTFRETLLTHALLWGNGYAEIERDGAGRPMWLWPLAPDRMCVDRDDDGRLVYVYHHQTEGPIAYTSREIFHLKGIGFDGIVGYPVVRIAAQAIGLGLAMETNGSSFFANGSRPGGILKYPGKTTPQILDETEQRWQKAYGGPRNANRVAAVDQGLEYVPIANTNVDSQWNESRITQALEICRIFRVPPHKVAELSRATFSNIEHQSIEFVTDTILPWAKRLEQEADTKLFSMQRQGRVFTKLNLDSLLRGDLASRYAAYQIGWDRGWLSNNDILRKEDMNTIGPDGDKRFVPLNMQLLEKAGEEPPTPASAPPAAVEPDAEEPEDDDKPIVQNRINGHGVN
jgi:HK97 family phage portal protein